MYLDDEIYLFAPVDPKQAASLAQRQGLKHAFTTSVPRPKSRHPNPMAYANFELVVRGRDLFEGYSKNLLLVDDGMGLIPNPDDYTEYQHFNRNALDWGNPPYIMDDGNGFIWRGCQDPVLARSGSNSFRYHARSYSDLPRIDAVIVGCHSFDRYGCLYSHNPRMKLYFGRLVECGALDAETIIVTFGELNSMKQQHQPDEAFIVAGGILTNDGLAEVPEAGCRTRYSCRTPYC